MSEKKTQKKSSAKDKAVSDKEAIKLLTECVCCLASGDTADVQHHVKRLRKICK